ncbi:MAG: hypothetical protein AAFQ39_06960 [Pseudomonadota bacterium]
MTQTYLYCRPTTGLNDSLVQLDWCWRVAKRQNRVLIMESNTRFTRDFFRYFRPKPAYEGRIIPHTDPSLPDLDSLISVAPANLVGRLSDFDSKNVDGRFYDSADETTLLSFDPRRDADAQLLVHFQCGGGNTGRRFLRDVTFVQSVADEILDRLRALPDRYASVHIRDTDYQTDTDTLLRKIAFWMRKGDLLVCSDNRRTLERVIASIPAAVRTHTVSDIPDLEGKPIHHAPLTPEDRHAANMDMFCDLIGIAAARRIFISRHIKGGLSGFSRLARGLHRQRTTLRGLFDHATDSAEVARRFG